MPTTIKGVVCYNTTESCAYLGVSRETLNNYVKKYSLKKYKIGLNTANYYSFEALKKIKFDREQETVIEYTPDE